MREIRRDFPLGLRSEESGIQLMRLRLPSTFLLKQGNEQQWYTGRRDVDQADRWTVDIPVLEQNFAAKPLEPHSLQPITSS